MGEKTNARNARARSHLKYYVDCDNHHASIAPNTFSHFNNHHAPIAPNSFQLQTRSKFYNINND